MKSLWPSAVIAAVTVAGVGAIPVIGAPIQWDIGNGGNGHYYDIVTVPEGITWMDARSQAEVSSYLGYQGNLVSIASAEENTFVVTHFMSGVVRSWIGGYQDLEAPDYSEPDGGWRWTDGTPWDYENWLSSGPNDLNGEHYLEIVGDDGYPVNFGKWNDITNDIQPDTAWFHNSYIVEYVPEPTTLTFLALGGIPLLRRRRSC